MIIRLLFFLMIAYIVYMAYNFYKKQKDNVNDVKSKLIMSSLGL